MPVLTLLCPHCGHEFKGMVFAGAKPPERWICGNCQSDAAQEMRGTSPEEHPWDSPGDEVDAGRSVRLRHPNSCPCCF